VSAAVVIFLRPRAGIALDRVVVALGAVLIAMTAYVDRRPPWLLGVGVAAWLLTRYLGDASLDGLAEL
jgi:hypothetical protein